MNATASDPPGRRYLAWLYLLLAVHAGIVAWAASRALAIERQDFALQDFATVALATLAFFVIAFATFGRRTRAIAVAGAGIVAAAVLTPGVVCVVLLCLLSAHVFGTRVLRFVAARDPAPRALPWPVPILAGIALWIGLLCAAASMKIHYAPAYALLLLLPLAFAWPDTLAALGRAKAFASAPVPYSPTERGWLALLLMVGVLHVFITARPDAGYDASTMHLQFAALVNDAHRWRYDVERYAWAVMPLGADWTYAVTYVLAGETAARAANLGFGLLACALVYELVLRHARRELALASVTLLASVPLALAETSSLYVEGLWTAFLLGALLVALMMRGGTLSWRTGWPVLALLAAGAMQCKVIGVLWLAPLLVGALVIGWRRPPPRGPDARGWLVLGVAAVVGLWPYANAWLRTGNPVFPFMNTLFRSPLADTTTSFNNPMYNIPLRPWSPYEMLTDSHRYIEGADGAAGFHWLLVLALVIAACARRRPADFWLCAGLACVYFCAVYLQQAYLRYLLPAFMLLAVLGGWAAADLGSGRATRIVMLAVGAVLCLLQVRLIHTGNWPNARLCVDCAFDARAREDFKASYAGDRVVADYLNRMLPDARVGFLMLNAPSPAGYVGYSRASNWHDNAFFQAVAGAGSAADIAAVVKRYGLTHIVYRTASPSMETPALRAYREAGLVPLWKFQDYVVAAIAPPP